ncbi:MAG: UDP-N-acetylglucosamine 1-carboxyvinyltransferase [Planctomycetota bacterium]|jgi:UDP-N-acetylglucosamine 1-carboxyvinyltransferase
MDAFHIQGGARLSGRVAVDGSKNAALPLMAASLLTDEPITLRRVPALADIANMARLLGELGVHTDGTHGTIRLSSLDREVSHARYDLVRTMRAGICALGPLVARRGVARVAMPGGCVFGARPVDLHLRGLQALGARIDLESGDIVARADRLRGATIFLGGPFGSTVLGTANVMAAATLAEGTTIIESAACEPEIVDLAELLIAMGARIRGAGSPRITVEGVSELGGADHTVMPDRIVASTWAIAAAITNGNVVLDDFPYDNLLAVVDRLDQIGVHVTRLDPAADPRRCAVEISSERMLRPAMITTQPYPGFPTDLQAQFMALLCLAHGNSIITEKIYPERFMHVAELGRMGAQLFRQGPTVMVQGVHELRAAPVMASDLRGSACLIMAGLAAEGTTTVRRVYHLDRGYARMEETLAGLGARIERFDDQGEPAPAEMLARGVVSLQA